MWRKAEEVYTGRREQRTVWGQLLSFCSSSGTEEWAVSFAVLETQRPARMPLAGTIQWFTEYMLQELIRVLLKYVCALNKISSDINTSQSQFMLPCQESTAVYRASQGLSSRWHWTSVLSHFTPNGYMTRVFCWQLSIMLGVSPHICPS